MPIIKKEDTTKTEESSPGMEVRVLVGRELGSRSLKIEEVTVAPNSRVPRHLHDAEEAMIVLEGTLDAVLGSLAMPTGVKMTIGPGYTVVAPPGTVHSFLNRYEKPARLLFVSPTIESEELASNPTREGVGFASEKGLTGYVSPRDRPLG